MSLSKREFLQVLGAASVAGMGLARYENADAQTAEAALYDLPPLGRGAGQVSFLHMTDCHAQLKPIYFREPSVNLGLGSMQGQLPHLVGEHLLKKAGVPAGTPMAHALTFLDFERAAQRYGHVGGFAHLSTLVKRLKASRPGALLLDGGDTWQGSATSLWTNAQDMVDACKLLGVDVMTGHWEFTYGMERVKEIVDKDFAGKVDFVAQNIKTADFGDPVFKPYVMREMNGVPVAIVGQAFPYTPIANPRYLVADWEFGIQDANMQKVVDEARAKGAQVVVVLSHNGMDVDLKMASRVRGIDAIFGGHTHDGVPLAVPVANPGGTTLVTNAGSNGKFLGVMDFEVKGGKVVQPPLPAAADLQQHAQARRRDGRADHQDARTLREQAGREAGHHRRPALPPRQLQRQLGPVAVRRADGRAGRRDRLQPGFRWGTSLLPGDAITRELMMDQVAITYPYATVTPISRRDDQDHPRGRGRQPVQPRPVLPAGRRHGARRRPAVHDDARRDDGLAHQRHAPGRQADRGRQDLQGGRLGAGGRRGEERRQQAGVGAAGELAEVAARRAREGARDQHAQAGRRRGQPRPGLSSRPRPTT